MTQLVLLLYEDPKADPLSEHRFHVELHFSPGAKTMDDPEFLTRSSPTRKRSEEEMRYPSGCKPTSGVETGGVSAMDEGDKSTVIDDGCQKDWDEVDASTASSSVPGLESSSHVAVTTSSNPGPPSEMVERERETVESNDGSSQDPEINTAEGDPTESGDFEAYEDKPFDETVYAGNERPRCSIGIDDYSDSPVGASNSSDSAVSSGTSIEESSGEEKVLTTQRNGSSESKLKAVHDRAGRRCKSDSEVTILGAATRGVLQGRGRGQEKSSVTSIAEEGPSKPHAGSPRPKAHSVSGSPASHSSSSSGSPDDLTQICKFSQGMFVRQLCHE